MTSTSSNSPRRRGRWPYLLLALIALGGAYWTFRPAPKPEVLPPARLLLPILVDGKHGLIDADGQLLLEPEYEYLVLSAGARWGDDGWLEEPGAVRIADVPMYLHDGAADASTRWVGTQRTGRFLRASRESPFLGRPEQREARLLDSALQLWERGLYLDDADAPFVYSLGYGAASADTTDLLLTDGRGETVPDARELHRDGLATWTPDQDETLQAAPSQEAVVMLQLADGQVTSWSSVTPRGPSAMLLADSDRIATLHSLDGAYLTESTSRLLALTDDGWLLEKREDGGIRLWSTAGPPRHLQLSPAGAAGMAVGTAENYLRVRRHPALRGPGLAEALAETYVLADGDERIVLALRQGRAAIWRDGQVTVQDPDFTVLATFDAADRPLIRWVRGGDALLAGSLERPRLVTVYGADGQVLADEVAVQASRGGSLVVPEKTGPRDRFDWQPQSLRDLRDAELYPAKHRLGDYQAHRNTTDERDQVPAPWNLATLPTRPIALPDPSDILQTYQAGDEYGLLDSAGHTLLPPQPVPIAFIHRPDPARPEDAVSLTIFDPANDGTRWLIAADGTRIGRILSNPSVMEDINIAVTTGLGSSPYAWSLSPRDIAVIGLDLRVSLPGDDPATPAATIPAALPADYAGEPVIRLFDTRERRWRPQLCAFAARMRDDIYAIQLVDGRWGYLRADGSWLWEPTQ